MNKNLITIFIALFIVGVIYFSIVIGKPFSEIFNDITVGTGALLAGLGGYVAFSDWAKDKIKKLWLQQIKAAYPRDKLRKPVDPEVGKTFILLRFEKSHGKIYIYDLHIKLRYLISSWPTYVELNYDDKSWIEIDNEQNFGVKVFEKTFNDYKNFKDGENISV